MSKDGSLLITNATVFDGETVLRDALSVRVEAGRINGITSGTPAHCAEVIDLDGAFLMPGVVDSHIHLVSLGESLGNVDLFDCRSPRECALLLAEHAEKTSAGQWIIGRGWRKGLWPSDDFPSAAVLDRLIPSHPVFTRSFDGHAAWVNSQAMQLAGVGAGTPSPSGGEIDRDDRGRPTGVFKENAINLVRNVIPEPSLANRVKSLEKAQELLLSLGVTCVHDMSEAPSLEAALTLAEKGGLRIRIFGSVSPSQLELAEELGRRAKETELVRLAGVKMFVDGSLNSQTAAMFEPFEGSANRGITTQSPAELADNVRRANSRGLPVFVHAIGDRGVALALDAIEQNADLSLPNRIEHGAVVRLSDIPRMQRLGTAVSGQPSHIITDIEICEKHLASRAERAYPFRSFLDGGVTLAFGTDAPVVSPDFRLGLFAAVARRDPGLKPGMGWHPEQDISVLEALRGFCRGAAESLHQDAHMGHIGAGFTADMVAFRQNPFEIEEEELLKLELALVVVGGRVLSRS